MKSVTNPFTGEVLNAFCPTGKGGGRDPHCSPGESTGHSAMSLKEFKAASKSVGSVKTAHMGKAEKMKEVTINGVKIQYSAKAAAAAHQTLVNSKDVHPSLWKQNKSITFASQKDPTSQAVAEETGVEDPDILARAGAGDGNITVWAGKPLSASVLAHESAHNLAHNIWGSTSPDVYDKRNNFTADRKFTMQGMRQRITNGVTDLGKTSPTEDFAEYVAAYNEIYVAGKSEYQGATAATLSKRPKSLATVKKLLGD